MFFKQTIFKANSKEFPWTKAMKAKTIEEIKEEEDKEKKFADLIKILNANEGNPINHEKMFFEHANCGTNLHRSAELEASQNKMKNEAIEEIKQELLNCKNARLELISQYEFDKDEIWEWDFRGNIAKNGFNSENIWDNLDKVVKEMKLSEEDRQIKISNEKMTQLKKKFSIDIEKNIRERKIIEEKLCNKKLLASNERKREKLIKEKIDVEYNIILKQNQNVNAQSYYAGINFNKRYKTNSCALQHPLLNIKHKRNGI